MTTPVVHYLMTVAYNGTQYAGFQYQKNGVTIQEVLEQELERLFDSKIRVRGASRTDAGVHAYGQRVQFQIEEPKVPFEKIIYILNRKLPKDISVQKIEKVLPDFHCIYHAKRKTYLYQVLNQGLKDPFLSPFSWHISQRLDLDAMNLAAEFFIGNHDFSAFRASGFQTKTSEREMYEAVWMKEGSLITFQITGNGFLYHMVRNMVGTLVEVGIGKRNYREVEKILASKDRNNAGVTAPPQGLFLKEIFYEERSFTLQNNSNSCNIKQV